MTRADAGEVADADTGAAATQCEMVADDRALMRARLAAMAAPHGGDSARVAGLRAILRDETLMAHVTANVDQWPALNDEQRDVLGGLLQRSVIRSRRRAT